MVNNDDLDRVLCLMDVDECIRFFNDMSEKERKLLSERALQWLVVSRGYHWEELNSSWGRMRNQAYIVPQVIELEAKDLAGKLPPEAVQQQAAIPSCIAALATSTFKEVMEHDGCPPADKCYPVLKARQPKWMEQWAKFAIKNFADTHWDVVRQLERDGILSLNIDSAYFTGMATGLGVERTAQRLQADPELLRERFWLMLEDQATVRRLLYNLHYVQTSQRAEHKSFIPHANFVTVDVSDNWRRALVELVRDGTISKMRLVRTILSSISAFALDGIAAAKLDPSWFMALYQHLELDRNECMSLLSDYVMLFRSSCVPIVGWALGQVNGLVDAADFPALEACGALKYVFQSKSTVNAIGAVNCLKAIAKHHQNLQNEVGRCAAEILSHSSPAVQKQAITMLQEFAQVQDEDLVSLVLNQVEYATVLNKEIVMKWLAGKTALPAPVTGSTIRSSSGSTTFSATAPASDFRTTDGATREALRTRCESLSPEFMRIAAVQSGWDALAGKMNDLKPVEFNGDEIPRLDPSKRLQPVKDLDELIFLVSRCLSGISDPLDLERVLDGIVRLSGDRPPDFLERTAAIQSFHYRGEFLACLATLPAEAWLSKTITRAEIFSRKSDPLWYLEGCNPIDQILFDRFGGAARLVAQGLTQPLLGTPTHEGGWIDPLILVERVIGISNTAQEQQATQATDATAQEPAHILEQTLALLRLAPDNRRQALVRLDAEALPGNEFIDALRYALGGDGINIGPTAELWVAAARSRSPYDDDHLVERAHPGLGPDGACAAQYTFSFKRQPMPRISDHTHRWKFQPLKREPSATAQKESTQWLLTAAMHQPSHHAMFQKRWSATIWPIALESFFANAAMRSALNDGGKGDSDFLERLYDPDIPVKPNALLTIALGLTAKAVEESGCAIEALIQAIDDGRVNAEKLGTILRRLYKARAVRPSGAPLVVAQRWAKALRMVAGASGYHAHVVVLAIQECVRAEIGNDVQSLLELLLELLIQEQQELSIPGARECISGITTSGKTQKLVQSLLALKSGPNARERMQAGFARALEKRIERVERWQRLLNRGQDNNEVSNENCVAMPQRFQ